MLIVLPPPQLLEISGADAIAFAHAQFSSDVLALGNSHWQWSAWLSAQGRVRVFFHLLRVGDEQVRLLLRGGSASALKAALAPYVFRAKVRLQVIEGLQLVGADAAIDMQAWLGALHLPGPTEIVHANGVDCLALPGLSPRWLMLGTFAAIPAVAESSVSALEQWRAADIATGLVDLGSDQSDQFLPNWLGLDRLGAASARKGCYPGQEIVARLHFKGGNKRWLYRIEFNGNHLPPRGTTISAQPDTTIPGVIVNAASIGEGQGVALAVLPLLASGTTLVAPDMPTTMFRVVSPAWEISD